MSICAGTITAVVLQIYFLKSGAITKTMTERNYTVAGDGITVSDERHQITRSWNDFDKMDRTPWGFYFRTSRKLAIIIPKRILKENGELDSFRRIIRGKT